MPKSGIREPQHLARFVIAVFLAYLWMIYLGVLVIQEQRLDLIADRFMPSLFRLDCLYRDYILEEDGQIPVSFRLPVPRSFVHLVLV